MNLDVSEFEKYKQLYKKFVAGDKWLKKQRESLENDKRVFQQTVAEPMDELWKQLTDEEKESWKMVEKVVNEFDGRIV